MVIFAFSSIESFAATKFSFSELTPSFAHVKKLFQSSFMNSFARSMKYAFIATLLALVIGYPVSYIITKMKFKNKFLILLIFILPMWTNMLLRVQTINNLFKENSFLSNVFGISIDLSNMKDLKIILVMTLVYLPFMIFPIYTVLEKIDYSLVEASLDLGCSPFKTFFKVTVPLSMKGVTSGIMMVFLPCAMGFTIPQIVTDGDTNYSMIGQLIERQFMSTSTNYNYGSLMSLIIIVFVLGSLYLISKIDEDGETLL